MYVFDIIWHLLYLGSWCLFIITCVRFRFLCYLETYIYLSVFWENAQTEYIFYIVIFIVMIVWKLNGCVLRKWNTLLRNYLVFYCDWQHLNSLICVQWISPLLHASWYCSLTLQNCSTKDKRKEVDNLRLPYKMSRYHILTL